MKFQPQLELLRVHRPAARPPAPRRAVHVVEAVVLASVAAYFFLCACGVFVS